MPIYLVTMNDRSTETVTAESVEVQGSWAIFHYQIADSYDSERGVWLSAHGVTSIKLEAPHDPTLGS